MKLDKFKRGFCDLAIVVLMFASTAMAFSDTILSVKGEANLKRCALYVATLIFLIYERENADKRIQEKEGKR